MVGAIAVGDDMAAAAGVTTGADQPAAQTDWTLLGIVALAGLVAGAITGVLAAGILAGRRRTDALSTAD
jgi:hypothetical protein